MAGLYLVFGRFFADAYSRARTFYGVTDKRLIIVTGSFSRRVRSLAWQSLPEATLTKRGNNGGVINFGPRLPFGLPQSDNIGGLSRSGQSLTPALDLPDRAREAYDAIKRAQQAVEREEPSDSANQTSPRFTTPAKLLPPPPRRVHGWLGGGLWFPRIFIMPHMLIGIGAGWLSLYSLYCGVCCRHSIFPRQSLTPMSRYSSEGWRQLYPQLPL